METNVIERKSIATCSLKDFLLQTNKIRKGVFEYLDETQILEIRKHLPEIPEKASDEEKEKIMRDQGMKNFSEMLDAALEVNIDATMRMIGLLFFTENEDEINSIEPAEIVSCIACKRVLDFFLSLKKSGLIDMVNS